MPGERPGACSRASSRKALLGFLTCLRSQDNGRYAQCYTGCTGRILSKEVFRLQKPSKPAKVATPPSKAAALVWAPRAAARPSPATPPRPAKPAWTRPSPASYSSMDTASQSSQSSESDTSTPPKPRVVASPAGASWRDDDAAYEPSFTKVPVPIPLPIFPVGLAANPYGRAAERKPAQTDTAPDEQLVNSLLEQLGTVTRERDTLREAVSRAAAEATNLKRDLGKAEAETYMARLELHSSNAMIAQLKSQLTERFAATRTGAAV